MRRESLLCLSLIAIAWIAGCTSPSRQNPAPTASASFTPSTQPSVAKPVVGTRPLIDFARGAGGFPLSEDALPDSRDELVASLTDEYQARVTIEPDVAPVVATGSDYPNLETLVVDLSGGKIKSAYRPSTFKAVGRLQRRVLHVDDLFYTATPLQYVDGRTNLRIIAHDVTLGLLHGRAEQAALVMTDAKDGVVHFEVPLEDLRSMFKVSAKTGGSRAGYSVSDVQMKLMSDDSRSLTCELRVRGIWVLLPTAFKLTGRIDIDDQFNAHLSNITCKGEDVGGALLAGFIDNALKKYDGRVMPLASFPGGRIKIRDVKISVDDSLRIYAAFGS